VTAFLALDATVQVAFVAGGFGVITSLIALFGVLIPKIHRNTDALAEVKEQVANSHGTNLRDDLDFIRDLVLDVKADIAWVRRDHLDLIERVEIIEGKP
jgi:hypothetical protein